jgi:hypothetical protein
MSSFEIPDGIIDGVAAQIHTKTTKDYKIPVVGTLDNLETPQIFEIMPFDQIDQQGCRFYAVDGSRNSHTFYNGVSLCFYQAGYVCFENGKQRFTHEAGATAEDEGEVRAGFDVLCDAGRLGAVLLQFPFSFSSHPGKRCISRKAADALCGLSAGGGSAPCDMERAGLLRDAPRAPRGILQRGSAADWTVAQTF